MSITYFGRHALGVGLAMVLLAACGKSQTGMSGAAPLGAMPAPNRAHQTSSSGGALIYTFGAFRSGNGLVLGYPSGTIVDSFAVPFGLPSSACSDSNGNVYVGGRNASSSAPIMAEYAYAATSASAQVTIGSAPGQVRGCSVDSTGDVAALIQYDQFTFAVAVLPQFTGTPQLYTDSGIYQFLSVGYDTGGNLFLLGDNTGGSTYYLAELPSGGSSFESISLSLSSNAAQLKTVQWDGKYMTLEGAYDSGGKKKTWPQAVYQLSISRSKGKVANTIMLKAFGSYRLRQETTSWIAPSLNALVLADAGPIRSFKYPEGGKETAKIHSGQGPAYMATVALPTSP